jgi:hypothetical protein
MLKVITHFFIFSETIFGYSDLRVKLYYAACSLDIYFGISYDEKITPAAAESVPVSYADNWR